ncbi:MAG: GNAT family N-acetyltransferase [Chloroflexota bacterium]
MLLLNPTQLRQLRPRFLPDRPGPLVGLHVLQTGYGACFVDRWPNPQTILVEAGGNYALTGRADGFTSADLARQVQGFVEAPADFLPLLQTTFPDLQVWDRVILALESEPKYEVPAGATLKRLQEEDAYHLWGLSPASRWISKTWGGPEGVAAGGRAWGAFVDGRLVSLAVPFFVGEQYEDLGVVTEPGFGGRGLSTACAGALVGDILRRGRSASWTTAADNPASRRVAEKLGFHFVRHDYLYVVGITTPQ